MACSSESSLQPRIALLWEVIEGPVDDDIATRSRLTISNRGSAELPYWRLYFNSIFPLDPESASPPFEMKHVNGDFWMVRPDHPGFSIEAGASVALEFTILQPLTNDSEAPAGFYFDVAGLTEPVEPVELTVSPLPARQDYAGRRYRRDEELEKLPAESLVPLVPAPVSWKREPGSWRLDEKVSIRFPVELKNEGEHLRLGLGEMLGRPLVEDAESGGGVVRLSLADPGLPAPAESYRLSVGPDSGVEITGSDPAGVFYGIQSLLALLQNGSSGPGPKEIGAVIVEDAPRFRYRGLHLDVARNFQSKESVLRLLDWMAFYKLNRFHFHLTDDEGWRFEVASLPELTRVGSRRGHTEDERDRLVPSYGSGPVPDRPPGSGHYSRGEMVEILRYAKDRHIEVIPEIDFPGHARAAIQAMEARARALENEGGLTLLSEAEDLSVYRSVQHWNDNVVNVCLPSTYRFIEKVVDELGSIYEDAGLELGVLHVGGDEVPEGIWERSPACRTLLEEQELNLPRYFLNRLQAILQERGIRMAGWEEIALRQEPAGVEPNLEMSERRAVAYVWNTVWGWGRENLAYQLANAGFEIVLCNAPNLYLEHAYSEDPREPGLHWAGFVGTRQPFDFIPLDLAKSAPKGSEPTGWVALSHQGRSRVLGIQGQLWSENLGPPGSLEYFALPKLLALAERAWAPRPQWAAVEDRDRRQGEMERDWERFANRLGQIELPRLDRWLGQPRYRIPPPGAKIEADRLHANVEFPGLTIRYTVDGSDPEIDSPRYEGPVRVEGPVKLRSFAGDGRSSRTVTVTR